MGGSIAEWVDQFLRNPPAILVTLAVTVIAAATLRKILEHAGRWSQGDVFLAVMETVLTLVGAAVVLKVYVFESVTPPAASRPVYDSPYVLFVTVMVFAILSMVVYLHFKRMK